MECTIAQLRELQVVLRVGGMARVPSKGLGPSTDPLPDQGLGALGSQMRGGQSPWDSAGARNRSQAKHQHQDGHRLGGGTARGSFVWGPSPAAPTELLCVAAPRRNWSLGLCPRAGSE